MGGEELDCIDAISTHNIPRGRRAITSIGAAVTAGRMSHTKRQNDVLDECPFGPLRLRRPAPLMSPSVSGPRGHRLILHRQKSITKAISLVRR